MLRSLLFSALVIATTACEPISDEGQKCQREADCTELCSPIGECVLADSALNIRVSWTIGGMIPSVAMPSACGEIADFEVQLEATTARGDTVAYYPVPCANGSVYYPNMPSRFRRVTLVAKDAQGGVLESQQQESAAGEVDMLFRF